MKITAFKMTELGPIPSDWVVKRLGEMLSFKNGFNANAKCYGTGTPVASVLDALSNEPITTETIATKVTADDKDRESFSLTKGDLIFTRSSETLEDVGRANVYFDDAPAMFGGFVIRGRFKIQANPIFVNYLLKTSDNRLHVMSQGAGAQHFNIGQLGLENVLIALPPLPEQHRIAAALSDMDELIWGLGKLVEKKRAIKTGAMQRLLTGQTRLPGFGGTGFKQTELGSIPSDWEVKRLGEVCSITTGHKDVNEGCETGRYPFFTCSRSIFASAEYSFDCEAILVAGNGDVGNLHYFSGKFEAYQRTYVLHSFLEDTGFIFHELTNHLMSRLNHGKIGSSIPYITIEQLYAFLLPLPPLPEQRAIAAVLSDMDAEIAALEAEKHKVEAIKQGMMQELLTGRTRLEHD